MTLCGGVAHTDEREASESGKSVQAVVERRSANF